METKSYTHSSIPIELGDQITYLEDEVVEIDGEKILIVFRTTTDEQTGKTLRDLVVPGFIEKLYDRASETKRTTVYPVGRDNEGQIERKIMAYLGRRKSEKLAGINGEFDDRVTITRKACIESKYSPDQIEFWR
ncbi:MAG TPA: hypothetical protein VJB66_03010 [Candidatus Nanoarchaeia archaeon]|nr:hypothetical protein [Candidatus Nanoarchaeia archaeon]